MKTVLITGCSSGYGLARRAQLARPTGLAATRGLMDDI
jgi:trans-2-enoyl-CoA reductase